MKKRIASLLTALLLLGALAGCMPEKPENSVAMDAELPSVGRYMEEEQALPLPAGMTDQIILGMDAGADSLCVITASYVATDEDTGCSRYFRHTFAPDGTATTTDETWLNELAPMGGNEMHVLFTKDGTLYMCFSDYDKEGNSVAHLLVSRDGGKTGEMLAGDGLRAMDMITSFGVLDNGGIAVANFYDGSLQLLDSEGNRTEEIAADRQGRINSCAANGDYIAFTAPEQNCVSVWNTADGTHADYDFTFAELSSPQIAVSRDGAVFLVDNAGIYRHAAGGTIWEKLVDGTTCTLGLPNFYAGFLMAQEDGAYPTFYASDLRALLVYRYDSTVTAAADKSLTVFSLHDNDTVRQTIVAFSRAHSDVKVTYTVAMEGTTGGTEQDYIKALNTELLAGTGPDILLLDNLPVDSYIEKDVLLDLTDVLSDAEPTLANVMTPFTENGALCAVPTGFTVPLAAALPGTENAFNTLSALADAAETAGETPLLSPCAFSYQTLALYLIKYYGGALQDGNAASVEAFLTDAKRVSDAIGCTDRLADGWDALKDMPQDELYEDFKDYIGAPQVFACASGTVQDILMQPVGSVMSCMEFAAAAEKSGASIVSVNGQFVPTGVVGVNKASPETEASKAFVKMMLSYDAQGGNQYGSAFPVNAKAYAEMLAYENNEVSSGYVLNDGGDFFSQWPGKAWRDHLGTLIASLTVPITEDTALTRMLLPVVEACLSGASTPAQAAEQMESLLSTFLSE